MNNPIRFPEDTHRHTIIGRTGSGKTRFGLWSLSGRSYGRMPWIIYDTKGDDLIEALEYEGAQLVDLDFTPKKKGLYIVRPIPEADNQALEKMFTRIWSRGRVGLYFDEGYMIPDGWPLRALLTQGRSKRIPIIMLSQRPVYLSRFVFSESEFFNVFALNDKRDRDTVQAFVPFKMDDRVPEFHSRYYDVGTNRVEVFTPCPDDDTTLKIFRDRLAPRKIYI